MSELERLQLAYDLMRLADDGCPEPFELEFEVLEEEEEEIYLARKRQ